MSENDLFHEDSFEEWWNNLAIYGEDSVNVSLVPATYHNYEDAPDHHIVLEIEGVGERHNYTEDVKLMPDDARAVAEDLNELANIMEEQWKNTTD